MEELEKYIYEAVDRTNRQSFPPETVGGGKYAPGGGPALTELSGGLSSKASALLDSLEKEEELREMRKSLSRQHTLQRPQIPASIDIFARQEHNISFPAGRFVMHPGKAPLLMRTAPGVASSQQNKFAGWATLPPMDGPNSFIRSPTHNAIPQVLSPKPLPADPAPKESGIPLILSSPPPVQAKPNRSRKERRPRPLAMGLWSDGGAGKKKAVFARCCVCDCPVSAPGRVFCDKCEPTVSSPAGIQKHHRYRSTVPSFTLAPPTSPIMPLDPSDARGNTGGSMTVLCSPDGKSPHKRRKRIKKPQKQVVISGPGEMSRLLPLKKVVSPEKKKKLLRDMERAKFERQLSPSRRRSSVDLEARRRSSIRILGEPPLGIEAQGVYGNLWRGEPSVEDGSTSPDGKKFRKSAAVELWDAPSSAKLPDGRWRELICVRQPTMMPDHECGTFHCSRVFVCSHRLEGEAMLVSVWYCDSLRAIIAELLHPIEKVIYQAGIDVGLLEWLVGEGAWKNPVDVRMCLYLQRYWQKTIVPVLGKYVGIDNARPAWSCSRVTGAGQSLVDKEEEKREFQWSTVVYESSKRLDGIMFSVSVAVVLFSEWEALARRTGILEKIEQSESYQKHMAERAQEFTRAKAASYTDDSEASKSEIKLESELARAALFDWQMERRPGPAETRPGFGADTVLVVDIEGLLVGAVWEACLLRFQTPEHHILGISVLALGRLIGTDIDKAAARRDYSWRKDIMAALVDCVTFEHLLEAKKEVETKTKAPRSTLPAVSEEGEPGEEEEEEPQKDRVITLQPPAHPLLLHQHASSRRLLQQTGSGQLLNPFL